MSSDAISPLSLWNKPNIMFESDTGADETSLFPYCILKCHWMQAPDYCFWMTALTLSWRHPFCFWVSVAVHCLLSKLLKTGSAEEKFCQQFIASLQLRFYFPQWAFFFLLQLAFGSALKAKFHLSKPTQFTFLEIKMHGLWRHFSQCTQ